MTEERAKKVLQDQIEKYGQEYDAEGIEALEMAIKALEQQPYYDCVSRTKVAEILKNNESYFDEVWFCIDLINKVDDLPPVTPQRPKGEWVEEKGEYGVWSCSECKNLFILTKGTPMDNEYHYCPNCGAEMEG